MNLDFTRSRQVNGQRLVYKFVELPYNYEPMKSATIHPCDTKPIKTESQNKPNKSSDFKVTQEPIKGKLTEHVTKESANRVVISKPTSVIVRCGRPRAINQQVSACANP